MRKIAVNVCRLVLAVAFILSGFVKAVDPLGTQYKIHDYLTAWGLASVAPDFVTLAVSVVQSSAEFFLGICLLFAIRRRLVSLIVLILMVVMTLLTLWLAIANPISDCGCFGDALVLTNWQTFWKNIVLLTLVIILLLCRKAIPQTFSWWAELVIALLALVSGGVIMGYSYTHLPPLDFRPYKIGNNIPALMEIPEDAEPDVYETTLIYEKDGVQQEFTLENYPKGDSTWTFVDQRSVLVKKGYEAPIHDFEILTMDFDDITYDVLESEEPVTLVTMYDLHKTDRKQTDKLLRLYADCTLRGEKCYFLTGSGEDDIYAFAEEIGMDEQTAEQVFCTIDPVTLKTIVRANPGMFVVRNGTVIAKHNLRNL